MISMQIEHFFFESRLHRAIQQVTFDVSFDVLIWPQQPALRVALFITAFFVYSHFQIVGNYYFMKMCFIFYGSILESWMNEDSEMQHI